MIGIIEAVIDTISYMQAAIKEVKNQEVRYRPQSSNWRSGDDSYQRYKEKQNDKERLIGLAQSKGVKKIYIYKMKKCDQWCKTYIYCNTIGEARNYLKSKGLEPQDYNFKCILDLGSRA